MEEATEKNMNILYATDDNFVKVLGVSMYSLLSNSSEKYSLNIFVVSQNISDENKAKLISISKEFSKCKLFFIEMPNINDIIGTDVDIKRYSESMFSRILITRMLPKNIARVIYLDCDTIVEKPLDDLYEIKMKTNKVIGAVNDYRSVFYQRNLKIDNKNCYINSGVLLIDTELYRIRNCERRLINTIKKYNGIFEFPDNDAICKEMQNEIELLPLKYNVSSVFYMTTKKELDILRKPHISIDSEEISKAKKDPVIVHFTTCFLMKGRPWVNGCNHPKVDSFLKYYSMTPWKNEMLGDEKMSSKKRFKRLIIKIIPRKILIYLCGEIHAYIKPIFQGIKYKKRIR